MLAQPKIESLRESFHILANGEVEWKERPKSHFLTDPKWSMWNTRWSGTPALATDNGKGYLTGTLTILAQRYRLQRHRVIYAMHHGKWPEGLVDHIDGDPSNNKIENLRVATNSENLRNCRRSLANKSGATGVFWFERTKRWMVSIGHQGKQIHLGYYQDKDEAIAARKEAEVRFGYSKRHGEP